MASGIYAEQHLLATQNGVKMGKSRMILNRKGEPRSALELEEHAKLGACTLFDCMLIITCAVL
jgi:hypothetical protein